MKKIKGSKRIFLLLEVAIVATIILTACSPSQEKKPAGQPAENDLPDMSITLLDGTLLKTKGLPGKTVLVLFQTDCDHCQREATDIERNILGFSTSTLYFITSSSITEIEKFARDYKLNEHKNVHFASTSTENILNNFGPIETPSIYVYSKEHRLVKSFNGEVSIAEVLKYI